MAGCRPLTDTEVALIASKLVKPRDKALFILGIRTGFRISELLSLRISDVYVNGSIVDTVKVRRKHMKARLKSREIVLHDQAKEALLPLVTVNFPDLFLFKSQKGVNKAISRMQAHTILSDAYDAAGITGSRGTHMMRKTFAEKVYNALEKDLLATCEALGHSSVKDTQRYIQVSKERVNKAILNLK